MNHWTQELRQENVALREAINIARAALRDIPQSRLDKEATHPHANPSDGLVYRTCAEEVSRLAEAALNEINDRLAAAGV